MCTAHGQQAAHNLHTFLPTTYQHLHQRGAYPPLPHYYGDSGHVPYLYLFFIIYYKNLDLANTPYTILGEQETAFGRTFPAKKIHQISATKYNNPFFARCPYSCSPTVAIRRYATTLSQLPQPQYYSNYQPFPAVTCIPLDQPLTCPRGSLQHNHNICYNCAPPL